MNAARWAAPSRGSPRAPSWMHRHPGRDSFLPTTELPKTDEPTTYIDAARSLFIPDFSKFFQNFRAGCGDCRNSRPANWPLQGREYPSRMRRGPAGQLSCRAGIGAGGIAGRAGRIRPDRLRADPRPAGMGRRQSDTDTRQDTDSMDIACCHRRRPITLRRCVRCSPASRKPLPSRPLYSPNRSDEATRAETAVPSHDSDRRKSRPQMTQMDVDERWITCRRRRVGSADNSRLAHLRSSASSADKGNSDPRNQGRQEPSEPRSFRSTGDSHTDSD